MKTLPYTSRKMICNSFPWLSPDEFQFCWCIKIHGYRGICIHFLISPLFEPFFIYFYQFVWLFTYTSCAGEYKGCKWMKKYSSIWRYVSLSIHIDNKCIWNDGMVEMVMIEPTIKKMDWNFVKNVIILNSSPEMKMHIIDWRYAAHDRGWYEPGIHMYMNILFAQLIYLFRIRGIMIHVWLK